MANAIANQPEQVGRVYRLLLIAFALQIAGRLVDLRWHATHEEFEGGIEQLQAHWLIWFATLLVIAAAVVGLRVSPTPSHRQGYALTLIANLAYVAVAVVHFFQHLNHLEVDWTHVLLVLTNVLGLVGIIWLVAIRARTRTT
ncbi:MAG: hypothetical protein M3285_04485 [Actinomycetota bacterium]|nr:hypothetical protein [Actinomycetota bacterium]